MYLTKVELTNIRGISQLTWTPPEASLAGWHVVLGNNGSGKSSFLRAIALALVGQAEAAGLRQSWDHWLSQKARQGTIELNLSADSTWDTQPMESVPARNALRMKFGVRGNVPSQRTVVLSTDAGKSKAGARVWGAGSGWFSAAYGPFRRFGTGDDEYQSLPRLARHVSLFDERATMVEALKWLRYLKFQQLEQQDGTNRSVPNGTPPVSFQQVRAFVNQDGFLPNGVSFVDATSDAVLFEDANGVQVRVEELGDGFRSILSLTFELLRQLSLAFSGSGSIFSTEAPLTIEPSGIVLIDEIDAHLHPSWQRDIGFWLRQHFPNIQFIVTTHSPLVCQAANEGSVFLLPRAGSDNEARMLAGEELNRLLYGNILDAYATEPFARSAERSPAAKVKRKRLADLNVKELREGLSASERREQDKLRAAMPTAATSR
jgi:predicted ATPase